MKRRRRNAFDLHIITLAQCHRGVIKMYSHLSHSVDINPTCFHLLFFDTHSLPSPFLLVRPDMPPKTRGNCNTSPIYCYLPTTRAGRRRTAELPTVKIRVNLRHSRDDSYLLLDGRRCKSHSDAVK